MNMLQKNMKKTNKNNAFQRKIKINQNIQFSLLSCHFIKINLNFKSC